MKRWNISKCDLKQQKDLIHALNISPVIAQLLINRGLTSIDHAGTFLTGDVSELYNPFLMEGMHEAVTRVKKAVDRKEKILIHGDYDVDGITAIALLVFTLRHLGIEPVCFIPDRLTEGYGLGEGGVERAVEIGASLVITVDCGISSFQEIASLNARKIDAIITDHHEVPDVLPPAYAVINPRRKDCAYPDKNLSGVGVAFKLCEALCSEFHSKAAWDHIDLVSLGTVADVVPVLGENRILVKEGLKLLNNGTSKKGIRALIEASGLKNRGIGSFEIGFILGPRINAMGRMGSADMALRLLLTDDLDEAGILARRLNDANRQRQRIETTTLKEAMAMVERDVNFKDHKVIVLHGEDWHTGVIGIVASRISDRFYRPCILISTKDGIGRGSGRSIENFHLFEALTGCGDILEEYGGHKYACGLKIFEKNLREFRKTINEIADNVLVAEDLVSGLDIDMEIALSSIDQSMVEDIAGLEPFGEANSRPVFCSKGLKLLRPPRVVKGEHIKMWVTDGKKNLEAIGFGLARDSEMELILRRSPRIDIAYTVSLNTWQGMNTIQLKIQDIKHSHGSEAAS